MWRTIFLQGVGIYGMSRKKILFKDMYLFPKSHLITLALRATRTQQLQVLGYILIWIKSIMIWKFWNALSLSYVPSIIN